MFFTNLLPCSPSALRCVCHHQTQHLRRLSTAYHHLARIYHLPQACRRSRRMDNEAGAFSLPVSSTGRHCENVLAFESARCFTLVALLLYILLYFRTLQPPEWFSAGFADARVSHLQCARRGIPRLHQDRLSWRASLRSRQPRLSYGEFLQVISFTKSHFQLTQRDYIEHTKAYVRDHFLQLSTL